MTQFTFQAILESEICCKCGIQFAMPAFFRKQRQDDKQSFYCPNGHSQAYVESEEDRLRRQVEREQREAAALRERAINAEHAQKKAERAISRHKKRAAAGLCPCCNRTVAQLAAHMKTKHSDFMLSQGIGPHKQLTESTR